MKTIKPQKLGVLTRIFENGREPYFVVTILVFFPLSSPAVMLSEQSLWRTLGPELGAEGALDAGMPKPRGEILVTGRAYPSGGKAQPGCAVRVSVGPIDKVLHVVGDRCWQLGGMTEPTCFTEMPIDWAHAFGGTGFPQNPLGKGHRPTKGPDGKDRHALPNIEDPRRPVRSPRDTPDPAGLGAYDFTWPQRFSKIGTYDAEWQRTRFPGFAKDLDLSLFSAAPKDQQLTGFFLGDEPFQIEHMHPTEPVLSGRLPGLSPRAFVTHRRPDSDERFVEIAMRLDTVHFFPHLDRGLLLYRGMMRIEEDDAADILHLIVAAERPAEPRPLEHYTQVLAQRLDRKRGHLYVLKDGDLLPGHTGAAPPAEKDGVTEHLTTEGILRQRMKSRAERQRREAIEMVERMGGRPEDYGLTKSITVDEPPTDPEKIAEYVIQQEKIADEAMADVARHRKEAEETARELYRKSGVDYDKLMEGGQKRRPGPPRGMGAEQLDRHRGPLAAARASGAPMPELERMLEDPRFRAQVDEGERRTREGYKLLAHHFPEPTPLDGDEARALGEELLAAVSRGDSISGRDFSGASLPGAALTGADLRGVFLESANLSGAKLDGADLSGSVLARAKLDGACLTGARLDDCNAGAADLTGADLTGASLRKTTLHRAKLRGAALARAHMERVDLGEAELGENDFTGVTARGLLFHKTDLRGARLDGVQMKECVFIEARLQGSSFDRSRLEKSVFIGVDGEGATLRDADLDNLRVVHGCSFCDADFRGTRLRAATLRGTRFNGSRFEDAKLDSSDLSECELRSARFDGASAREARFIRADLRDASVRSVDLMSAMLGKARLHGTSFEGSNLFRADLSYMAGDTRTTFERTNLTQARIITKRNDALQK